MCGIAGIMTLDGRARGHLGALRDMSEAMRHRGPDDAGYLAVSFETGDCRFIAPGSPEADQADLSSDLLLAHRRLSILDLSPMGRQPMRSHDGRCWIVYNGEIYNHGEIRRDLEADGVVFRGHSDTEVLLEAYVRLGVKALDRLNGMFAFALWDGAAGQLVCARDRVGIKPFYYTVQKGIFLFASDIRTLIQSRLYRPEVGLEGLYHALSFGVAPRPMTAFKDVKELRQAHFMIVEPGRAIRESRYWHVPVGVQDLSMTEGEAEELFLGHLRRAVDIRLVADVPVGTFMSGGLDSTMVTAIASGFHPGIKAFTLAFLNDSRLNELKQAQATARMHPIEHLVRSIRAEDILEHIDDMVECYEEPFYDLSPNYAISQFVAENGVTVVLGGLGGDEILGGYPYYRWLDRWRALRWLAPLTGATRRLPLIGHLMDRLHVICRASTASDFAVAVRTFLTDNEKQRLFTDPEVRNFNTIERIHQTYLDEDVRFFDDVEAISYMDILNYIGNHHVYRVDKFTMRFSLECRLPLLDFKLIEACARIPTRYKVSERGGKLLLKSLARGFIHDSCLNMRKKGFDFPTARWIKTRLLGLVEDKLGQLSRRGIFEPQEIQRIYRQFLQGGRSYRGLWQLVSTELWLEKFMDAAS